MLDFLKARLKEKTTWVSILTIVGGLVASKLAPGQWDVISGAVITILGSIGIFTQEKPKE